MDSNSDDKLYSELFNAGVNYFSEHSIRFIPNLSCKVTSFLEIRLKRELEPLEGFNPPKETMDIHRLVANKEWGVLEGAYKQWVGEDDVTGFWRALFKPAAGKSPLDIYVNQMMGVESEKIKAEGVDNLNQGIRFPHLLPKKEDIIKCIIPHKDWFTDTLNDLEIKDVLTLFPPTEQELLALCIGRFLVGASKNIPLGGNEPLNHNWRIFPILYGKEPGQGKSILCGYIIEAMQYLGYTVTNFSSLNKKFNMDRIVGSHLTYRDDFTSKTLEDTLKAPDAKPIITGATIEAEGKGTDAIEVPCVCGLLANVNKFDAKLKFNLDAGMTDRIRFISTLSNLELQELRKYAVGISQGTPSLKTYDHIKYLSEKLELPRMTIMLKFLSLCYQKFWDHYSNKTLEKKVRFISTQLRTKVDNDLGQNLSTAMFFSILLHNAHGDMGKISGVDEIMLTPVALEQGLANFSKILIEDHWQEVKCLVRQHWLDEGRPAIHPWVAFEKISPLSIAKSYCGLIDQKITLGSIQSDDPVTFSKLLDLPSAIDLAYKSIYTNEGYPIGSGISYVQDDWNSSNTSFSVIKSLVEYVITKTKDKTVFEKKTFSIKSFKELLKLDGKHKC